MERSRFKSHKTIIGRTLRDPGAHMYHAATGVKGDKEKTEKRHRLRKSFAAMRGKMDHQGDENLHHWGADEK